MTAAPAETYVPQTGSFFSSPPDAKPVACFGSCEAGAVKVCVKSRAMATTNDLTMRIANSGTRIRTKKKRIMDVPGPRVTAYLPFLVPFFGAADGFAYFTSTEALMACNMPFADSAFGPVGANSRYFWNASAVPGTGVTFPSAVT